MKKLFLCAMVGISAMAFAKRVATWTSSCGIKHTTSFADHYTDSQVANAIANLNYAECGVRPTVTINP